MLSELLLYIFDASDEDVKLVMRELCMAACKTPRHTLSSETQQKIVVDAIIEKNYRDIRQLLTILEQHPGQTDIIFSAHVFHAVTYIADTSMWELIDSWIPLDLKSIIEANVAQGLTISRDKLTTKYLIIKFTAKAITSDVSDTDLTLFKLQTLKQWILYWNLSTIVWIMNKLDNVAKCDALMEILLHSYVQLKEARWFRDRNNLTRSDMLKYIQSDYNSGFMQILMERELYDKANWLCDQFQLQWQDVAVSTIDPWQFTDQRHRRRVVQWIRQRFGEEAHVDP